MQSVLSSGQSGLHRFHAVYVGVDGPHGYRIGIPTIFQNLFRRSLSVSGTNRLASSRDGADTDSSANSHAYTRTNGDSHAVSYANVNAHAGTHRDDDADFRADRYSDS